MSHCWETNEVDASDVYILRFEACREARHKKPENMIRKEWYEWRERTDQGVQDFEERVKCLESSIIIIQSVRPLQSGAIKANVPVSQVVN